MKRLFAVWFLLGVPVSACAAGPGAPLQVRVLVYNYAGLPDREAGRAQREAGRIYREIGVQIEWTDCPVSGEGARPEACHSRRGPSNFELRLLSRSMVKGLPFASTAMGYALQPHDGPGSLANVFAHRAADLASNRDLDQGLILGHLIAHELAHLLLGPGGHSSRGLMRDGWGKRELAWAAQGSLTFLPAEAERIRWRMRVQAARR
ncbi:MAG: hypothetical protein IT158_03495 [Bryobacterales bacterium]|nr:hypothetical protein [Bryobacterales bacterium]